MLEMMNSTECNSVSMLTNQKETCPTVEDYFSAEDYEWLVNLAGYGSEDKNTDIYIPFVNDNTLAAMCISLANLLVYEQSVQKFEELLEYDEAETYRMFADPTFTKLVMMGLQYGVTCGNGACANYLGALYYMGEVVDQDYLKAKELYELAEKKGIVQAIINLGYIYEYGRTGERDLQKAFNQYAKAVALTASSEALYKMGDMYSRAQVVEKDLFAAYIMYEKSLSVAKNLPQQAQPAIRIAKLIASNENVQYGIPYDLMRALELYQLAERGLRIDIAQGQLYYTKRLKEALEGQEYVRCLLDNNHQLL
ncbi:MAG: sel1 repeat family protein [Coriobacteriales bacterium]|nr:sel1 repeat family protein [Coriobacteriales bacterium]